MDLVLSTNIFGGGRNIVLCMGGLGLEHRHFLGEGKSNESGVGVSDHFMIIKLNNSPGVEREKWDENLF